MQIIADLQLHSKYSRAVSPEMVIPKMYEWNLKKGIGLLATGDWTHPMWIRELKMNLEEQGNGLLKLKKEVLAKLVDPSLKAKTPQSDPLFLLSGEVSCIYSHNGKLRRNHILLFASSFSVVDKVNAELVKRGCNIASDGRPILGLTSQNICEIAWGIDPDILVIPSHAWTPWFSVFGSMSGYDSLEECFGVFAKKIYAIETGLSSDPSMNWRIKELDTRTIISNSDSHSGPKLMREATIYEIPPNETLSFASISQALKNYQKDTQKPHIAATVEFYPEEGKYHFSGHRNCNTRFSPQEVKEKGKICPACGKPMTIGVANRIEDLAGRSEAELKLYRKKLGKLEVTAIYSQSLSSRSPYILLVPLQEIIAEALKSTTSSQKTQNEYIKLVTALGGEFNVLVKTPQDKIAQVAGDRIAEGIQKVRTGNIVIIPGFDGVFGTVKVWSEEKDKDLPAVNQKKQLSLF